MSQSTGSEQERAKVFASLGFSPTQALVLAATQGAGEHVEPVQVRQLLDAGCPHELALRIVL
ncbi:MAG: hypothetical protein NVSMB51_01610 [Solirubrobacteraceae bacterium]